MIQLKEMLNIELNWAEKEFQEHLKIRATFENIQKDLADEQAKRMKMHNTTSGNLLKTEMYIVKIKF